MGFVDRVSLRRHRHASGKQAASTQLHIERLEERQMLAGDTFYVDGLGGSGPGGNDSNDGLTVSSAFATIQAAANVAEFGDTIQIRGGTYRELVTLPRSGTTGNPITFESFGNEDVTISAGEILTGWTQHSGNIYKTTVPDGYFDAIAGRQGMTIFVDGVLIDEAHHTATRTKITDFLNVGQYGKIESGSPSAIRDNNMTQFPDGYWDGAQVQAQTSNFTVEVRRIDSYSANGTIRPDVNFSRDPNNGYHYFIFDSLKALDSPGEWYFDEEGNDGPANTLYMYAPGGGDPDQYEVEARTRGDAFNFAGNDYITIKDVTMRGGDIFIEGVDHSLLQGITFIAGDRDYGVDPGSGIKGFVINGDHNVVRDSEFADYSGLIFRIQGDRNSIINNYFHDVYSPGGPGGISLQLSNRENLISHNTFDRFGRSAIQGKSVESVIQYNDFSRTALVTFDVGSIYLINNSLGNTEIHHNTFHDIDAHLSSGLYLDNQTTDVIAHHNIFYDTGDFGGKINLPTSFALFFNNTFYSGGNVDAFSATSDRSAYGSKFFNNIYSSIDNDLFASGDPLEFSNNLQSTASNNFVNAGAADFRLRSTSAAVDAGIEVPGITDGFTGSAPDIGALELGEAMFATGHNFVTPPNPVYDYQRIVFTSLVKNPSFEDGYDQWTAIRNPGIHNANAFNHKDDALGRFGGRSAVIRAGQTISQTLTGLAPNTYYTAGAWVKIAKVLEAEDASVDTNTTALTNHRSETAVGQLKNNDYLGFPNVDFDEFDRIQIVTARTGTGDSVELRVGSPTGQLLGTVSIGANKEVWAEPEEFNIGAATGTDSLYLVFKGSGDIGLVDEIRLFNTAQEDGVVFEASNYDGDATTSIVLDDIIDYPSATPRFAFKTGPTSTTATLSFQMLPDSVANGFIDFVTLTETTGDLVVVDPDATSYRYDVGPSAIEDGYTQIVADSLGDVFWSEPPTNKDRGTTGGNNPFALLRDHVESQSPTTLSHRIANGTWRVTAIQGDAASLHNQMTIRAEGELVAGPINSASAQYVTSTFDVQVSDGQLDLEFRSEGGSDPTWVLNALELEKLASTPDLDLGVEVDLATGRAFLRNRTSESIQLKGYTLFDPNGALVPSSWQSLDDTDFDNASWEEANPTNSFLSEINPQSFTEIAVGQAIYIGDLGNSAALQDLRLEYLTNGATNPSPGAVTFKPIGFADTDLTIEVNSTTGVAFLKNETGQSISLIGYTILGQDDALTPTSWNSLDDQDYDAGAWDEANPTTSFLSELNLFSSSTLANGDSISLGTVIDTQASLALELEYLTLGAVDPRPGFVRFVSGPALPGDYNGNNMVDAADYTVWRDALGTNVPAFSGADGNGDGVVTTADLSIWRTNFGNTLPPAATASVSLAASLAEAPVATVSLAEAPVAAVVDSPNDQPFSQPLPSLAGLVTPTTGSPASPRLLRVESAGELTDNARLSEFASQSLPPAEADEAVDSLANPTEEANSQPYDTVFASLADDPLALAL